MNLRLRRIGVAPDARTVRQSGRLKVQIDALVGALFFALLRGCISHLGPQQIAAADGGGDSERKMVSRLAPMNFAGEAAGAGGNPASERDLAKRSAGCTSDLHNGHSA